MGEDQPPASTWTRAFVVLALLLLLSSSAGFLLDGRPVPAAAVGVVVAAVILRLRSARSSGGSGSVWDAIPSWQYSGRHAESGGLTRDEQERALRDVQREADARREPHEGNRRR